ncbi:SEL1-like repeat protein [Halomonas rhizosphaerae]|uniref:SEL1-like repeat protein n=1 Tax=Halomonas rhizosphaerae TaxID=3043296 RepID=A0ABT6V0U1_9GAMM|nr:SEL1-like repeat protein [Halomonas rhizosphaerae]MDI5891835.1 SEL1-like repeat protein [Halomonas rhizosphaerae]
MHHTEPLLSDEQVRKVDGIVGTYQFPGGEVESQNRFYLRLWPAEERGYFIEGYMLQESKPAGSTLTFPAWLRVGQRSNGTWLGEIRHDDLYLPMPMARSGGHFEAWPLVLLPFDKQQEQAEALGFTVENSGKLNGADRSRERFLSLVDALMGSLLDGEEGLPLLHTSFDFAEAVDSPRRSYLQDLDGRWYRALEAQNTPPSAEAVRSIQILADRDDPWAHYAMARFYGNGYYVERDIKLAREHAERALELGESKAHGILGFLALSGLEGEADVTTAQRHYRLAAAANDPAGTRNLGLVLLQSDNDIEEGVKLLNQAVGLGDPFAAYELGVRYTQGQGVTASATRAFPLMRQAAEWGHTEASYQAGWALENGKGVAVDAKAALAHYRRAANQRHIKAQIALGRFYWEGTEVTQSPASAISWFQRAAEREDVLAMSWLGHALSSAPGELRDDAQAAVWFKRAADGGNAFAMWRYGVHLADGRGVKRDMSQAHKWLARAEEEGEERARQDFKRVETLITQAVDRLNRQQSGQTGGPTEEDLRVIYAAQTGAINKQQDDLRRRCENREFQRGGGDPLMAMQCVVVMAGGQMQTGVRGVRLIGCEKAPGRPGWNCDWQVALDINSPGMPGSLNQMMGQWQACTGRLVRAGQKWQMVERRC